MNERHSLPSPILAGRLTGYAAVLVACGLATALPACGSKDDTTCGKGTTKQGKECVAVSDIEGAGGASGEDGGTPPPPPPDAGAGGAAAQTDGGGPPEEHIDFDGITSASPANQTPPKGAGTTTPDSIRLTWTPASYPRRPLAHLHYEIYQSDTKGAENFNASVATSPPGSTSYVIQDLDPGTKYYFVVRAVSDEGTATDDNVVEKDAQPAFDDTPPDFSGGATGAEPAGPTSVKVSWDPATDDQTAPEGIFYRVYWAEKAGQDLALGAVSLPGATSAVVTGLPPKPEADYVFAVHAVDAAGNVEKNDVVIPGSTGPDETPPIFGGCVSVSDLSASTATVTWNAAVDDTTVASKIVYTVYASDVHLEKGQSLEGLEVGTFTGVTSGQVTGLSPKSLYRFVCRAKDEAMNEDTNLVIQTGQTSNDGEAPTFTGLTSAVASDTADETAVDLKWDAGTDDQTAQKDIRYRVYASLAAAGEDFTAPILTSTPGATGITVSKAQLLSLDPVVSNRDFYFVVRAADGAGNVDKNTLEMKVTTLVSFRDDIQPIFSQKCALLGCHTNADPTTPPKQGQNLDEGAAYLSIVNQVALEGATVGVPELKRVATTGNLVDSYMAWKITNGMAGPGGAATPITGSFMPPANAPNGPLETLQKETLLLWMTQGAKNN